MYVQIRPLSRSWIVGANKCCSGPVAVARAAAGRAARGLKARDAEILGTKSKAHFLANASIAIAYLLWPALVVQVLRTLDCSVNVAGTKYVASAVSVVCHKGAHARLHAVAIFSPGRRTGGVEVNRMTCVYV